MAEEEGRFDFGDVVEAITAQAASAAIRMCSATRATCRATRSRRCGAASRRRRNANAPKRTAPPACRRAKRPAFAGVPLALPALTRALKLQEKAGKVGFDWNDPRAVLAKLREEIDEVEAELDAKTPPTRRRRSRRSSVRRRQSRAAPSTPTPRRRCAAPTPSSMRRFAYIEARLAEAGRATRRRFAREMEALWSEAKRRENQAPSAAGDAMEARVGGLDRRNDA